MAFTPPEYLAPHEHSQTGERHCGTTMRPFAHNRLLSHLRATLTWRFSMATSECRRSSREASDRLVLRWWPSQHQLLGLLQVALTGWSEVPFQSCLSLAIVAAAKGIKSKSRE